MGEEFSTSNRCQVMIEMKDGTKYLYDNGNVVEREMRIGGPGELPEYTFNIQTSDAGKKLLRDYSLIDMWRHLNDAAAYRRDRIPRIKDVVFNGPATVVLWNDDTKTVVKCGDGDTVDHEKGLALAIAKKALGNKGNYYNVFRKWLPKE